MPALFDLMADPMVDPMNFAFLSGLRRNSSRNS
jgi:hypothetical protein